MSNTSAKSAGIGFFGLLTLLFVGLKLGQVGDVASWSWLWVLSPTWLPTALVLGVMAMLTLLATASFAIAGVIEGISDARKRRAKARRKA